MRSCVHPGTSTPHAAPRHHYRTPAPSARSFIPKYARMPDDEYKETVLREGYTQEPIAEGWAGPGPRPATMMTAKGTFGIDAPTWRPLDLRYDHYVGQCECIADRELPDGMYFTAHYSCLHFMEKPQVYTSEHALMAELTVNAHACTRRYFQIYLDAFTRAHGRLPEPHWKGRAVPAFDDAAHEAKVSVVQAKLLAAFEQEAVEFSAQMDAENKATADAAAAAKAAGGAATEGAPREGEARRLRALRGAARAHPASRCGSLLNSPAADMVRPAAVEEAYANWVARRAAMRPLPLRPVAAAQ